MFQQYSYESKDKQVMAEIQYVVYTDLENFLSIFAESQTVAQLVNDSDPLYLIHINRLITQVNLSNCIHYETQQTIQNRDRQQLIELNNQSLNVLEKFVKQFVKTKNQQLNKLLIDYQNIIKQQIQHLSLQGLHKIPTKNQPIDTELVSNILGSISSVDNDYYQLKCGKHYQTFNEKQLFQKIKQRQKIAKQKIKDYLSSEFKQGENHNQDQQNHNSSNPYLSNFK